MMESVLELGEGCVDEEGLVLETEGKGSLSPASWKSKGKEKAQILSLSACLLSGLQASLF